MGRVAARFTALRATAAPSTHMTCRTCTPVATRDVARHRGRVSESTARCIYSSVAVTGRCQSQRHTTGARRAPDAGEAGCALALERLGPVEVYAFADLHAMLSTVTAAHAYARWQLLGCCCCLLQVLCVAEDSCLQRVQQAKLWMLPAACRSTTDASGAWVRCTAEEQHLLLLLEGALRDSLRCG
jgi:hypothetical protein